MSHIRGLLVAAALLMNSGCEEELTAERKKRCEEYVKFGHLSAELREACVADRRTYEVAARSQASTLLENIYPLMISGATKANAHAASYDKSQHQPLPKGTTIPWGFLEEKQAAFDWRYTVALSKVVIEFDKESGGWMISGQTEEIDNLTTLRVTGVGEYALRDLGNTCMLFAYDPPSTGCRATVYLNVDSPSATFPEVAVMALVVTPPSKSNAFDALLKFEMDYWRPR